MAKTEIRGDQIKDADVGRDDLNVADSGKAVVRKVIQGVDISISATGADAGTGDATVGISYAEFDAGNSGTSLTIDWNNGRAQKVAMTGNCTFTLSNPTAGKRYFLKLVQGSGGHTYTWPGTVKWPSGVGPTPSGASKVDIIALYWDGTSYYGAYSLNY